MLQENFTEIRWGGDNITLWAEPFGPESPQPAFLAVDMPALDRCQWILVGVEAHKAPKSCLERLFLFLDPQLQGLDEQISTHR